MCNLKIFIFPSTCLGALYQNRGFRRTPSNPPWVRACYCTFKATAVFVTSNTCAYFITAEQKHSLLAEEKLKILQYLLTARKSGHAVKLRYGKVLVCGANAAGKTNFLNLLMRRNFQKDHKSTGVTNSQRVKLAFKAKAVSKKNEIYFEEISIENERAELVSHLPPRPVTDSNNQNDIKKSVEKRCTEIETRMATENVGASDKKLDSRLETEPIEDEKVWNMLTFVDTGGQPHLISILPAVNSFAMTTFIVHNLTESLDADVKVIQDGKILSQPYGCTHRQLIKTLASYASSIVLPDIQFLSDFKVFDTANTTEKPTSLSILGTHSHAMLENDIQKVDNELNEMFEHLLGLKGILTSLNQNYEYLIPVENDKQRISTDKDTFQEIFDRAHKQYTAPSIICNYLNDRLKKQDVYEVPLDWLILELEIRTRCIEKKYILITLKDVLKIGQEKELGDRDYIISGLRFHHLFGVLLYFEHVEGMQELVITNHQWLFDKLTNFMDYMQSININPVSDRQMFKRKGIFKESIIDVDKLKITEDFEKCGISTEPKKSFLKLLEHLRFIAPHNNPAAEYFMPTLLESFELSNLRGECYETNKTIFTESLLIQYRTGEKSGSFPRGFFCFLAVQLKIDKKSKWKVSQKTQAYNNLLTFCDEDSGHCITLIDRIFFLEIQVAHDEDASPIHNEVYGAIRKALTEVGCKFNVKHQLNYGFFCKSCSKAIEIHMTYPPNREKELGSCKYYFCTHQARTNLKEAHKVWLKV